MICAIYFFERLSMQHNVCAFPTFLALRGFTAPTFSLTQTSGPLTHNQGLVRGALKSLQQPGLMRLQFSSADLLLPLPPTLLGLIPNFPDLCSNKNEGNGTDELQMDVFFFENIERNDE